MSAAHFPSLAITTSGGGRPVVVIHGGGGPASVSPLVDHLQADFEVIAPTMPGFGGTDRPDWFTSVDDIALALLEYLRSHDLRDVAVVGSSVGGWVASAMAIFDRDAGRITRLALIDAVGVQVPGESIRDFFALDAHGVAEYYFSESAKFYVDPSTLTDAQKKAQQANMATLRIYAGDPYMHDPHLLHRLGLVDLPVLGIWGDSDRIVSPGYGRAFLSAFPRSEFHIVPDAGHLPHIEQPAPTFALLDPYLRSGLLT